MAAYRLKDLHGIPVCVTSWPLDAGHCPGECCPSKWLCFASSACETHSWALRCFPDHPGIGGISLVGLGERPDGLRWNQLGCMTMGNQLARPMVRATASIAITLASRVVQSSSA